MKNFEGFDVCRYANEHICPASGIGQAMKYEHKGSWKSLALNHGDCRVEWKGEVGKYSLYKAVNLIILKERWAD